MPIHTSFAVLPKYEQQTTFGIRTLRVKAESKQKGTCDGRSIVYYEKMVTKLIEFVTRFKFAIILQNCLSTPS
jgi:hypothetical protein